MSNIIGQSLGLFLGGVTSSAYWPLASDTDTFNCDAGLGEIARAKAPDGRPTIRSWVLGFIPLEWVEAQVQWVAPHSFTIVREFIRGPLTRMEVTLDLSEEEGGVRLAYTIRATPKPGYGLLLKAILRVLFLKFRAVFLSYGERARTDCGCPATVQSRAHPTNNRLLDTMLRRVRMLDVSPSALLKFIETLKAADEATITRLRPYALARAWGIGREDVVDLFLKLRKGGAVGAQWEPRCPHCRGTVRVTGTPEGIEPRPSCESCGVDFTVDFHKLVELTFRPHPDLRPITPTKMFCAVSPQRTAHIVIRQELGPQSSQTVCPELQPGVYIFGVANAPGWTFEVVTGGMEDAELKVASPGGLRAALGCRPRLTFVNDTNFPSVVRIERAAWDDDALTGGDVLLRSRFREMFPMEIIRPGVKFDLGEFTIGFADVKESTPFFRTFDDLAAVAAILEYHGAVRGAIEDAGGRVVKTSGDGVMFVFGSPSVGLEALLQIQKQINAYWGSSGLPIRLRVGLHVGRCVAVTDRGVMDFFGNAVNYASRLEGHGSDADAIVSQCVFEDAGVQALFLSGRCTQTPLRAILKGFGEEPVYRIRLS